MRRYIKSRTPRTRAEIEAYLRDRDNLVDAQLLEEMADDLLAPILKDKSRVKSARQEYTILSERQMQRRWEREVQFSCLPKGAKAKLGLTIEEED